jgi:uncharacterized membrane protein
MTFYPLLPIFALFVLVMAVGAEKTFTWYALIPVFAVCALMLVFAALDLLEELVSTYRERAEYIAPEEGIDEIPAP